jgi:protein-S-isoprenylcysteine O-methyltransferase Ste14
MTLSLASVASALILFVSFVWSALALQVDPVLPRFAAFAVVAAFVVFVVVAQVARIRGRARRGPTDVVERGLAHWVALFLWVPYVVVGFRIGPEVALPSAIVSVGVLIAAAGVAFAVWAVATLGRHYDLELEIHRDHELVQDGPYRIVRHPIYTGLSLHFVGACLATGNVLLIAGTLLVTFPAFYLRARTEERLMRDRFGARYDAYAREVGMLVPLL